MSVLGQCMEIINLTSLAWKGKERYSVVAHSFRVMAKAKNYDEMVVGMMHELYAASAYTRGLYHCDVDGDPQWGLALDTLTPPVKLPKFAKYEDIQEEALLSANIPHEMFEKYQAKWFIDETRWTPKYFEWIRRIAQDRIARNVMIYDLEDKLDVLLDPKKYVDELGPQYFALPWKKHYCVSVKCGRRDHATLEVPRTDDPFLLRDITEVERNNLIEKYTRALDYLRWMEDCYPTERQYTEAEQKKHAQVCLQWFGDWVSEEEADKEYYGDEEFDEDGGDFEDENGDGDGSVLPGDDGTSD